jgi:hypothetical protein
MNKKKITVKESSIKTENLWNTSAEEFLTNFNATIYNGSNWTITNIVFRFKIGEGKSIKLIGSRVIIPLSMGDISIKVPEQYSEWEVDEIRGYKD